MSPYKEICTLASELNKPELTYTFLHLANHNAIWSSKKGASLGFTKITTSISDTYSDQIAEIIPKMYRYQFDPTPKVQQSFISIWNAFVPSTTKAVSDRIILFIISLLK